MFKGQSLGCLIRLIFISLFLEVDICRTTSKINYSGVIIKSPGYPNSNYPNEQKCERVVRFNENKLITIEFFWDFDVEYCWDWDKCDCDFIEIRNGDNSNSPLVSKECGWDKPPSKTFNGSSIWMRFKSDAGTPKTGFAFRISMESQSKGIKWLANYKF